MRALKKRGYAILIVLAVATIVGALSFSILSLSQESQVGEKNVYEKANGYNLIHSGLNYLKLELDANYKYLSEKLPYAKEGDILLQISGGKSGNLNIRTSYLNPINFPDFKTAYQELFSHLKDKSRTSYLKELKIYLDDFSNFPETPGFKSNYPQEKIGFMVIEACGIVNKKEVKLKLKKAFKIFNSKLPVLNHFSLFIRDSSESQTENKDFINSFEITVYTNDYAFINSPQNNQGLIIQNYPYQSLDKLEEWGWVHIGRKDKNKTYINSTAGPLLNESFKLKEGYVVFKDNINSYFTNSQIRSLGDNFYFPPQKFFHEEDINTSLPAVTSTFDLKGKFIVPSTESLYKAFHRTYIDKYYTGKDFLTEFPNKVNTVEIVKKDMIAVFPEGFGKNNLSFGISFDKSLFDTPAGIEFTDYGMKKGLEILHHAFPQVTNYTKSGLHLFGQFVWIDENNDHIPFNTPTFIFGNVWAKILQYSFFANIQNNSDLFKTTKTLLNGMLEYIDGAGPETWGYGKDKLFVICIPNSKYIYPQVLCLNIPKIKEIFFDMLGKTFVGKLVNAFSFLFGGKKKLEKKIIKMAIKMIEAQENGTSVDNSDFTSNLTAETTTNAVNQQISQLQSKLQSITNGDLIFRTLQKHHFDILSIYPISWAEINSNPDLKLLQDIASDPKKFSIFRTQLVELPFNKNFEGIFFHNWWNTRSNTIILQKKIEKLLKPYNFILPETGATYNELLETTSPKEDFQTEVKVAKSHNLWELDFIKWIKNRISIKLETYANSQKYDRMEEENWKLLKKFFFASNQEKQNILDLNLNNIVYFKASNTNIGEEKKLINIKRGGIILVKGDIHIKSSIIKSDKKEILYIVSEEGNIYIDTPLPIFAVLIAPEGKIISSQRVDIIGAIAAKNIFLGENGPEGFSKGGFVRFDPYIRKNNYRVVIAPEFIEI